MGKALLDSSQVSAFCESMGLMLSAGIQSEEAVSMLAESTGDTAFKQVCDSMYARLANGSGLGAAMAATSAFPKYAVDMVCVGEASGHIEPVLASLAAYYDEEDRLFAKIRASIGYPAALLCVMSVILAFTVAIILPVFVDVYT